MLASGSSLVHPLVSETYSKGGGQPYQPLLTQVGVSLQVVYSSNLFVLVKVMEALFNPVRPDLPDLTYHSYGLADILKSGFR